MTQEQPAPVECDHCKASFTLKPQAEKLPMGKFMDYFTCPHCETRYNVSVITEKGIRFRNRLRQHYQNGGDAAGHRRLVKRLQAEVSEPPVKVIHKNS